MKRKKKKKRTTVVLPIIVFFILCITGAGLFLLKHNKNVSKPVFEEEYLSPNRFKKAIRKVDRVIYESLYDEGVSEEDISFSKVINKHEKDLDWDFTEVTVRLKDPESMKRLAISVSQRLSGLHPSVSFKSEDISVAELALNIRIFNLHSHRLKLLHDKKSVVATKKLPKIAIIIDDIGYDETLALSFMNLDIPVCIAVLPDAPFSKEIAAKTIEKDRELLLHLPMEPKGYPKINPGKNALMVSMDRNDIKKIVRDSILKFPGLKGVNHHMGSLFSEDYNKMKDVLDEINKYDLYYVDSRTTNRTVAYRIAKELGIRATEKSLFIDNDLTKETLKYQMDRLLGIARYKGSAVGIGHPHKETLNILKDYTKKLKKNYEVVPVSELVH